MIKQCTEAKAQSGNSTGAKKRNAHSIPAEIIALLGTESDADLARKACVSRSIIRHARLARGIDLYKGHHLPAEIIGQLGTMRDSKLAKLAGRPESTIRSARERRGIPRFVIGPQIQNSTSPSEIQRVSRHGAKSRLAKVANRSESTIRSVSERRGKPRSVIGPQTRTSPSPSEIERDSRHGFKSLTNEQIEYLKEKLPYCSTSSLSRRTGISTATLTTLRKKLNIPVSELRYEPSAELLAALGQSPDTVIAERFNLKKKWVRKVRKIFSIPAYKAEPVLVERFIPLLGKVSDRFLARYFGYEVSTYRLLRERLGISPYQARGRHSGKPSEEVQKLLAQLSDLRNPPISSHSN